MTLTQKSTHSQADSLSRLKIVAFTVGATLLLIGAQWLAENPPAVRYAGQGFLGGAAMKDLSYILGDGVPHPTGSLPNAAVKSRLETLLRGLGYEPEEQNEYACSEAGVCANVENIVVRIPGIQQTEGVLLDAHYDSVAAAPGAADNGSGVAITLEIARILKTGRLPSHPVLFLFDDGEEQQLLGAQAFVQHNRAARDVKWVVNMDARGVTGPSMMFETSDENAGIIQLYARTTKRPVANSLMFDLYRQLPSDTNFTVFRGKGWQGFNLAFLGKTQFYHRTADAFPNTDGRSVQHQGEEALSLIRALAESPPRPLYRENAVYFDLLSHLFWWPTQWSLYGTALASLLLVCGAIRHRGLLSAAGVAGTTLIALLTLCLTTVAAGLGLLLVSPGNLAPVLFVAHPAPFAVAFFAMGVAVTMALYRIALIRIALPNYLAGLCLFWTIFTTASALLFVGGSYLFLLPSLAMTGLFLWVGARSSIIQNSVLFPAILLTGVLWIPLLRLLYNAAGLVTFPLVSLVAANLLLLFLPLLRGAPRRLYPGALAALLVTILSAIIGMSLPRYTKDSPFPLNLSYVQLASGGAHWVTASRPLNHWRIRSLIEAGGFHTVAKPETLFPWIDKRLPMLEAPAPHLALGTPELQVLSKKTDHTEVTVIARMQAAPGTDRSVLYIAPAMHLHSIAINGIPIPVGPSNRQEWRQYQTTVASQGAGTNVTLTYGNEGSEELYLGDLRYHLPPEAAPLLKALPPEAMASQDGDTTLVIRSVVL